MTPVPFISSISSYFLISSDQNRLVGAVRCILVGLTVSAVVLLPTVARQAADGCALNQSDFSSGDTA
jgi:hypothetical protein